MRFIYSVRDPGDGGGEGGRGEGLGKVLFLERLVGLFGTGKGKVKGELVVHLTSGERDGGKGEEEIAEMEVGKMGKIRCKQRRVSRQDVLDVLGPVEERHGTLCYICGVPTMTDELVEVAQQAEGMDRENVLFERWW